MMIASKFAAQCVKQTMCYYQGHEMFERALLSCVCSLATWMKHVVAHTLHSKRLPALPCVFMALQYAGM